MFLLLLLFCPLYFFCFCIGICASEAKTLAGGLNQYPEHIAQDHSYRKKLAGDFCFSSTTLRG
jgi:hypothetical protein